MDDATKTLLLLAATIVLFVWNKLPVELVAIASALVLYALGVLDLGGALGGFGDSTVILIAALFVVSEGLDASGVTTWIGHRLIALAGESRTRLLCFTMLLAVGLTALINVNGAVAALLPMVVMVAVRRRMAPSKLLMPMVFAASAGSLLLLTGSPVNVIFADATADAGVGRIGFAEFALVGLPVTVGSFLVLVLFSNRLLPERDGRSVRDLGDQANVLAGHYGLDRFTHLGVNPDCDLIGRPRARLDLPATDGITVVTVLDAELDRPSSSGELRPGDRITAAGDPDRVAEFAAAHGLAVEAVHNRRQAAKALINRHQGVAEIVIPPRSSLLGASVRPGRMLAGDELVVLAVQRQGADRGDRSTHLQVGDCLLVEGRWEALDAGVHHHDVMVVDSPDLVRRQAVAMGRGSTAALVILAVMVALLASGVISSVVAVLLAAGAMVLSRVVTVQGIYRAIPWSTVLMVAGMLPMSTAIQKSGAGEQVAGLLVDAVREAGPYALLAALFVVALIFGQLISNTATALVMIPIAVSAAAQLGVSAKPVLVSLLVASAASFLTPIATPSNMLIMAPAGYRFGDYWKLGLPLVLVFFAVSVGLVPSIWRF